MWIKKNEYEMIQKNFDYLNKELSEIRYRHKQLLNHLGLEEWEIPAVPPKSEIITREEFLKRVTAAGGQQQQQYAYQQAAMRQAWGKGGV